MGTESEKPVIHLFTDGSSSGNPGPGGWGAILKCGNLCKELSGGEEMTTNNRMELTAVIEGLEAIKWENAAVVVTSDSKYVVDAVTKGWLDTWLRTGFKGKKNPDLWTRFDEIYRRHRVSFVWVKGHAGHPENERCDELATTQTKYYLDIQKQKQ